MRNRIPSCSSPGQGRRWNHPNHERPLSDAFSRPECSRFLSDGSRKGNSPLVSGGYVRATAEYDFNGIVDDVDFYPALIGQPGKGNFARMFQMDITTSTLFLNGRTNQASGRLRGVYRRKLPWRWEDVWTSKCVCAVLRIYHRIQLRFIHGPFGSARNNWLCRSERFRFLSYHSTELYARINWKLEIRCCHGNAFGRRYNE